MAVQVPVAAPARQKRLGGIHSVATWVTNARIGAAESVIYQSDGCTFPQPAIGLCYGETVVTDKSGVDIENFTGIGEPFALYGGVDCFIGPDDDFIQRARNIVLQGEDRVIEARLAAWAEATGVGLTATADIVNYIAAVEQDMDANYLGRGFILMSRADAVRAAAAMAIEYGIDGLAYTVNGTPVVASGAVTEGVFGLGATTVLRSELSDISTVDWTINHEFAVAEAVYAIIVDCDYATFIGVTP